MRFIFYTALFFALQGVGLVAFQDQILGAFGRNWPASWQSGVQRDALLGAQRIAEANREGKPKTFIVGPSSAPPFFEAAKTLPPEISEHVVSLYSGSQVLHDAIRLMEAMEVPGSTVVVIVTPHKFANMWYDRSMVETHYINGMAGKYMLPSPTFDRLWEEFRAGNDVNSMVWTQKHWRLFQPLMPYAYYLNDMVDQNVRRPIRRLKQSLKPRPPRKPAGTASLLFDTAWAADAPATAMPASIAPIASQHPTFGGNASAGERGPTAATRMAQATARNEPMASEYGGHISVRKLKEFRDWRDFSKTQFEQSVRESFAVLEILVEIANARGLRLVLAEAPFPDVEEAELLPLMPEYGPLFEAFAARHPQVRVVRFDPAVLENDQKYFSDYVHLNKDGKEFYRSYLRSPFRNPECRDQFEVIHLPPAGAGAPPAIDWNGADIVHVHEGDFIRRDLIGKGARVAFADRAAVGRAISLSGLGVEVRPFVDTLRTDPEPAPLTWDEARKAYDLEIAGASHMSLSFNTEANVNFYLRAQWWTTGPTGETYSNRRQYSHFATPFGWAFQKPDLASIAAATCVKHPYIAPGHAWTRSQNWSLPFDVDRMELAAREFPRDFEVRLVREARRYLSMPDLGETTGGDALLLAMPAIDSGAVKDKIANYGVELTISEVVAVRFADGSHTPRELAPGKRRRIGVQAPQSLALRRTDGSERVLFLDGIDLVDIALDGENKEARLSAYLYHADEHAISGYDLTPARVKVEGELMHFERTYRNLAITDFVPAGEIGIRAAESSESETSLAFRVWQPNANLSTFIFVEHADYQDTASDHLLMYGNPDRKVVEGEGVLGNRIPYTKTVFTGGSPLTFRTAMVQDTPIELTQPTITTDPIFSADLQAYHDSGLVEIAAHQAGTTPYANEHLATNRSLAVLRERFGNRVWTDHGGIPSNISFNGWDRRQTQYFVIDAFREAGIDYAWPVGDRLPVCRSEATKKPPQELCSISQLPQNEASSVLYSVPMLMDGERLDMRPKFFRNIAMVLPDATIRDPLVEPLLSRLVDERGATLLHFYPGRLAIEYDIVDGKRVARLRPYWNEGLARLARYRDAGLVHVAKVSDWLDYVDGMRAVRILESSAEGLTVDNPGKPIAGASFAVMNIVGDDPGACEVRYFAADIATGRTVIGADKIARKLACGTSPTL
ncbi:MAG: hypothetical protein GC150_09000 [Rhizobiales bacterium]|nr:hypothetical protein [Hyphomicrobiales bacterium]